MLNKKMDIMQTVIIGIVSIVIGIIIIISRDVLMFDITMVFALFFVISGALTILDWMLHLQKISLLLYGIVEVGVSVFIFTYPNIPMAILPILFSIVLFLHALVHFVTGIIYFKNSLLDWVPETVLAIFFTVFFLTMFLEPLMHLSGLLLLIGSYLVLYGFVQLKDALFEVMKVETKNKLRRKVRLQIPVVLSALIPHQVLMYVNRFFSEGESEEQKTLSDYKENLEPDIEVLVHVTKEGFGIFGHVDICYHDYVISYGNYDAKSYRFKEMLGDGVLFITPKEKYIPFVIADSKKTLFCFGLSLNERQQRAVRKRIREIFQEIEPWEPDYKKAEAINDEKAMASSLKYYANRLYKSTGAKLYKFKRGPYKTYFVLKTNCVALADAILGKTGIDIIGTNGILTPGTYYDYFNHEFLKSRTNVISRTIYR